MWGGLSIRLRIGVTLTFNFIKNKTLNITNYKNLFSLIFIQSNGGKVNY